MDAFNWMKRVAGEEKEACYQYELGTLLWIIRWKGPLNDVIETLSDEELFLYRVQVIMEISNFHVSRLPEFYRHAEN